MPLPEEPEKIQQWAKDKRVRMLINTAAISLTNILVFTLIGWFLDEKFSNDHRFLIIFLVISFPITQFMLYKRAEEIMKK